MCALDGNRRATGQLAITRFVFTRTRRFRIRCGKARFGLPDHGQLQLIGRFKIGDEGFLRGHCAFGLGHGGAIVAIIDLHQQVTGMHDLVVGDSHLRDVAGHLGTDHGDIAADIGVVGVLDEAANAPPVTAINHAGYQHGADGQAQHALSLVGGRRCLDGG